MQPLPAVEVAAACEGGMMSAVGIETRLNPAVSRDGADEVSERLENAPASAYLWRLVILLSLGGCFEIYDLFHARPQSQRTAHHPHAGFFRLFGYRRIRGCDLRRPVRR